MLSSIPNFDELRKLAEQYPEQLDAYLHKESEKIIADAPESMRRRLQGLQFQVDCQREIHGKSSLGACVAISEMMCDSLHRLNRALNGEDAVTPGKEVAGRVIPFSG